MNYFEEYTLVKLTTLAKKPRYAIAYKSKFSLPSSKINALKNKSDVKYGIPRYYEPFLEDYVYYDIDPICTYSKANYPELYI